MSCLALDAMGVIFRSADDVAELLVPFIAEQCGSRDAHLIEQTYEQASLGKITAEAFWQRVGLSADLEDEYLARHALNPGVPELLARARAAGIAVWCLSNDIGRWSRKLRNRLDIERYLDGAVISGEVGLRKPSAEIYRTLLHNCGCPIDDLLFVDDREKNVLAARELGIETLWFDPQQGFAEVDRWISRQA